MPDAVDGGGRSEDELEMMDEGWRDDRRFNERELGGVRKHEKREGGRL